MNWNNFLTYNDSTQNAFETICNQLFEKYLRRKYGQDLIKFKVINGAGGDGGIEAYGELTSGDNIAVQSKWFRNVIKNSEINQIRNSVTTAKELRPQIKKYIICIPHDISSLKYGKGVKSDGKKPIDNFEEKTIDKFTREMKSKYPDLTITWWFDDKLLRELQEPDNEGVHKYWFDKEIISINYLSTQFQLQKSGWLNERYIPELHGQGLIHKEYNKICFSIEWRHELYNQIQKGLNDLQFCILQIERFIPTNLSNPELNTELESVSENLKAFYIEVKSIGHEIISGNDFYKSQQINEYALWQTKLKLESIEPNNIQKNVLPKLVASLDNIYKYNLPQYIEHINCDFNQNIRLILGGPGTGKTHGLANCVEKHLNKNSPALIIPAKGNAPTNWTNILSKSLELNSWNKIEILSALESIAIRNDKQKINILKEGDATNSESTKVLICIDGLDEDVENEKEWYARIRESVELSKKYPRVKFIFSARRYFYDNREIPKKDVFKDVFLPREGDISINEIAEQYFNYYNIQLSSFSLIKGLDNLFALRLFCEQYKNQTLTERDIIVTATNKLLNLKIDKANQEFISSSLERTKGKTRNPISDSLEVISNYFYSSIEIEHESLNELIAPVVESYLNRAEIDLILDYLVANGFLIRSERIEGRGILEKRKFIYNITYQSIIEHILSSKISKKIKDGDINKIPPILQKGIVQPLDSNPIIELDIYDKLPNQKIIQNIVNEIFIDTGKLIGENNFLKDGFNEQEIFRMQMDALMHASKDLSEKYKVKVDEMFYGGYYKQYQVLKHLIVPSSESSENVFGAEYLHSILINQISVFERDKLWSGLDLFERGKLNSDSAFTYPYANNTVVFNELGSLYYDYAHNELPLVYAWGLSTIDQELRNKLRVSLAGWALRTPKEFLLLLKKIFHCNDPQIQEDLASIMLGVAGRLKDKDSVRSLAMWSIENIFNHLEVHRNIIVRQGFRAIVEKAYQLGVITDNEVKKSRPKPIQTISLLPIEKKLNFTGQGNEYYPIVHDLAWYVIDKAFFGFLEVPSDRSNNIKDNDCREAKILLDKYRKITEENELFAHEWTLSVAIPYIKSLGFSRIEGNGFTEASGGSKSKIFTYEEKYTWLAVHYIQGYLSDYIPMIDCTDKRAFVKDYTQITYIPNPAESIIELDDLLNEHKAPKDWIIKEFLSKEIDLNIDIKESITNWVTEEPKIDFEKWLNYSAEDINPEKNNNNWIALYNHTLMHDSKKLCLSQIDIKACLIYENHFNVLHNILKENPSSLRFIKDLDRLYSSPQTNTYCNPSDIVWMTWIDEDEKKQTIYDVESDKESELFHMLTRIIQNSIDGEIEIMLPSKKIREMLDGYELIKNELKNSDDETVAFNFKKSEGTFNDNQEILFVNSEILKKSLKKEKMNIVWFVDLFKQKNPLNKGFDNDFHIQKSRKYFCWLENGTIRSLKLWDENYKNSRD